MQDVSSYLRRKIVGPWCRGAKTDEQTSSVWQKSNPNQVGWAPAIWWINSEIEGNGRVEDNGLLSHLILTVKREEKRRKGNKSDVLVRAVRGGNTSYQPAKASDVEIPYLD